MMQGDMDRIYKNMPLEKIPWNKETPPEALYQVAFICISLLSPRHTPRRTKTKRTPAAIPRRRLELLLNATWY